MSVICKVDGKEFKDEKSLHLALRGYGLNKEKYYHTYYPKKDLLTGDTINFKTKEQYFNSKKFNENNIIIISFSLNNNKLIVSLFSVFVCVFFFSNFV